MNSKKYFFLKSRNLLATLLLATGILLSGCASNEDVPAGSTAGSTPKAKMTDSEMEKAIKAKFDTDAQLKAADLSVDANADRNEATLSGTVETQALKTKAVELAKSASAGLVITDKIDVKPRELTRAEWTEDRANEVRQKAKDAGDNLGASLEDAWIHTKIVTKLIANSATPERKINVDVNNNVVTLRGTVDSATAKTEAENVAKETEGVKSVKNQLKVGSAQTASPTPAKTR